LLACRFEGASIGLLFIFLGILVIGAALFLLHPFSGENLGSHPNPVKDYAEAERRIAAIRAREDGRLIPDARIKFLTHGGQTERAIVLVHGYTNCARQFVPLGEKFHRRGYNVLIATLPHHGLPDRMTDDHARLTAEELAAYGDEMADIAQGLGRKVTFAGLSCGGVVSAWAWACRPDVAATALMAPAFGFRMIPAGLTLPAVNLVSILPNIFSWWNPVEKAEGSPPHTYPRYSLRALREILRLAYAVRWWARKQVPLGKELIVITNPKDWAVSSAMIGRALREWRELGATYRHRKFDPALNLDHDFIDPAQPNQPIEITYPLLLEWIAGKE
jgi:pimeloyl-ACP methyl ester carboxylesterase